MLAQNQAGSSPWNLGTFVVGSVEFPPPPVTTKNDAASFRSDISLPDGSIVSPNQVLTKTWRLQNSGSTTWGDGYQLVFLRGDRMGAPASINVPSTSSGQTVDLSVSITAPSSPGSYQGFWRLRNPQGTYFGSEIWISIGIGNSAPPPVNEAYSLQCDNCPATIPPGYTFTPTVRVKVNNGQHWFWGAMLRNTDNNLFGAYPHVAVSGTINSGQTYDLIFTRITLSPLPSRKAPTRASGVYGGMGRM